MATRTRRSTRSRVPRTYATTLDFGNALPAGTPHPIDISAALETVLGRELHRSTVRTVRGYTNIVVNPAAANTFTRARVGIGIMWMPTDLVTDGTAAANVPDPLGDEYRWPYRRMVPISYMPTAAVAGSDIDRYKGSAIPIRLSARLQQPDGKHALFFVASYDSTSAANITSITFDIAVQVGAEVV